MRVLILSCNTGQGHNSTANAIKDHFAKHDVQCDICDSLELISHGVSVFMSKGHTFMYRNLPWLFQWGYRYLEKHTKSFNQESILYKFFTQGSKNLYDLWVKNNYDVIICTHVFPTLMLTEAVEKYHVEATTCFVATDYTCSPSVDHSRLDYYFIPGTSLIEEFVTKGLPRNKIIASGIPVKDIFFESFDKSESKKSLGLTDVNYHIVMMCGSMGCGPVYDSACAIAESLSGNNHLTVVCGTNKKLYSRLTRQFLNYDNIHIMGYADNVPLLLQSADLYITKPGGISITEASATALPMLFIDAVSGCEEYNMRHFVKSGGALSAVNTENLVDICTFLLDNEEMLLSMSKALKTAVPDNPSEFIYGYLANNRQYYDNTKEMIIK